MNDNEVKVLIETFKSYRDLLTPIQSNLNDFIATYSGLQGDIDRLNQAFSGDAKTNLEKIYRTLSGQAEKATDLASQIDRFMKMSNKYTDDVAKLLGTVEKVADKLENISALETTAESYLPEGVHGYRLEQQQLTGLLTEPEVTVKDAEGNDVPVTKDPETGIYHLPVTIMEATEAEKQLALNAIQAYAKYMIRADSLDAVKACFDINSEIYDVIRKYEAWTMQSYDS